MQVNRTIKDNPALDDVDHALGRPYRASGGYRNRYATCCPDQKAAMRASPWWEEGDTSGDMTWFHVTEEGREALRQELSDVAKYGRLFEVSCDRWDRTTHVVAKSHSSAKYAAFIEADLDDWTFMEFCKGLRVRLAGTA